MELPEGGLALQFEHPTIAGVTLGGWMNRADEAIQVCHVNTARHLGLMICAPGLLDSLCHVKMGSP